MIDLSSKNPKSANYLKAACFAKPEWTPCTVSLMQATWDKYGDDLDDVLLAHPRIFGRHVPGDRPTTEGDAMFAEGRKTDCWGTVWDNVAAGLSSHPVAFPLEDWDDFDSYTPPDPMKVSEFGPREDWDELREELDRAKAEGRIARTGCLMHGFMYMRLFYLRRFENLMMDMALDHPRLPELIAMVEGFNAAVIGRALECGPELLSFGDDLGLQGCLPMGPALWRKWIGPSYRRLFEPIRSAGVLIRQHTDGHILEIIPDLIDAGVTVLNPQIGANGLDGLRETARGKVCIHLDLDRQAFPFFAPAEVEAHIVEAFEALRHDDGGLMLHAECEPDVPLENIEAICSTLERVCGLPDVS
jgi:uroporphyrinogen decarboxylase